MLSVWAMILMLVFAAFSSPAMQTGEYGTSNPTFFIAGGELDEYGQGIAEIRVYENTTGSWVELSAPFHTDYSGSLLEWNASQFIKLGVYCWLNATKTGSASTAEGQNYIRHNVTVTNGAGVEVWSQENLTYVSVSTALDPIWYYGYSVVLNFEPAYWQSYTVSVTYEVYYGVIV